MFSRTNMEAVYNFEKQGNIYSQLISQGAKYQQITKKKRKNMSGGKLKTMTAMIEF